MESCPSHDFIQDFLAGQLDVITDQAVADHLDECPNCQQLVRKETSVAESCLPWSRPSSQDTVFVGRSHLETATLTAPGDLARFSRETMQWLRSHRTEIPRLIGKYEIVRVLGRGGMSIVYQGVDPDLGKEFAVKVLSESRKNDPASILRLRREMKAIGRMHHPNVVDVAGAGSHDDGRPFLVMELLRGCDLNSHVQAHGPLPADKACSVVISAALGLQHAHEKQLVHRDVKPANLFRQEVGAVKLLDFGLASFVSESTDALHETPGRGFVMGSVDYVSPEQAVDAAAADYRSDIYSLGCTLAFLLTGRPLFSGDTISEILRAHASRPRPSLLKLLPNMPSDLNRSFQKLVARHPNERAQSMQEVIDLMSPFAASG